MALNSMTRMAMIVSFLGCLSFILGVIAENKKPPNGTPIQGKDVVICQYPSDPTMALGALSVIALAFTAIVGHAAVYFPYNGKSIPNQALFSSSAMVVFFIIAEVVSVLALVLMLWATITEGLHHARNIHHDLDTECPTAKTGLFGGAAFLALDAALFWLICQMLTSNARADYFDEDDGKGDYGHVYATEVGTNSIGATTRV